MPAHRSRGRAHRKASVRLKTTARLTAVGVVLALIGSSGVALAYWRGSGAGTGSATTAVAAAVTLSPGTPAAALYPGGQVDVTVSVSNPNRTVLVMGSLALDPTQGTGGLAVDAAHPDCAVSALSLAPQTNAGAGWDVPAMTGTTNGTLAITLPNALHMSIDAADACQGAQFTVYLVAGP